jgi:transposase
VPVFRGDVTRAGSRKIARYGDRFKATAVKLSGLPGVLIKDVAEALDIHPFMLSLWRKQVRDGVIVAKSAKLDVKTKAELKRLKELERASTGWPPSSDVRPTSEHATGKS